MNYTKGECKVSSEKSFEGLPIFVVRSILPKPDGRIQRVADTWIEGNAHLIAAAINACQSVNPDNPLAVAESIKDMYEALRAFIAIMEIPHEKFEDFELAMKPIVAQIHKAKAKADSKS